MEQSVTLNRTLLISGLVQGVGFRPFIWSLASQYQINGEVYNDGNGVVIIAQGKHRNYQCFKEAITEKCPPLAYIETIEETKQIKNQKYRAFEITESVHNKVQISIVPDSNVCKDCLDDIFNENNRRYQYPFTNCTNCGPRFSIVKKLPYDRQHTSMHEFSLCASCQSEYDSPADRRFHAQPNACASCGPSVWSVDKQGNKATSNNAIDVIADLINKGSIVAIKGLGGYQLVCDASNSDSIARLRRDKNRPDKPLAIMARSVRQIEKYCFVSEKETTVLEESASPIVLLKKKGNNLPDNLAPGQNKLGFVLPYTPIHHLLMAKLNAPVVFTSGNISGNPQVIKNEQATNDLSQLVDGFLHHDREIVNRVDDSVVSVFNDQVYFYRRSRGYSPLSLVVDQPLPDNNRMILALGAQLKNTFSIFKAGRMINSQYIGNLDSQKNIIDFQNQIDLQSQLFDVAPSVIAIDKHPNYYTTQCAYELSRKQKLPIIKVQHHHAHLAACLFDNNHSTTNGEVVGIVMDGLGYGEDETLWGGEILQGDFKSFKRIAHLEPVAMPGGTKAVLEPWRMLVSHLFYAYEQDVETTLRVCHKLTFLNNKPVKQLLQMIRLKLNSPLTSSCGRLFDAVSALLFRYEDGISYEGQAAINLQELAERQVSTDQGYSFDLHNDNNTTRVLLASLWHELLEDIHNKVDANLIAFKFHNGLAKSLTDIAIRHCNSQGINTIALCGGVFQNELLLNLCIDYIQKSNLRVYFHQQLPANDACISVGQAAIAMHADQKEFLCA